MSDIEMRDIKKHLASQLEKYVYIIKKEYGEFIPKDRLDFLNAITNYEDLIKIEDTGTITCFVRDGKIYFPLLAYKVLNSLKKIPGFGMCPNHTTYNKDTVVINDNTFNTYILHAFLNGLTSLEFYEEMILHETMHLCGFNGNLALLEGITELKTRELAKKYSLKTNSCGYPKEVKLVNKLQTIFGSTLITKLGLCSTNAHRRYVIFEALGDEGVCFFGNIINMMEEEFQTKYNKYNMSFTGLTAPIKKALKYNEINYDAIYKVIDDFCFKYNRDSANDANRLK